MSGDQAQLPSLRDGLGPVSGVEQSLQRQCRAGTVLGEQHSGQHQVRWPFWDGRSGVFGESLGWVTIRLHPHDEAIAEGEHVRDGHIPERAVGQAAVDMVDDDDVISPPGGGRFRDEFGPQ